MESEIDFNGEYLVSTKEAAEKSGYSQDYVGQLARGGEIQAQRKGRRWLVNLQSVLQHQRDAAEYVPVPPNPSDRKRSDNLVMFDGIEYISARRAAAVTGYTSDYITQLARSGSIRAQQKENRWYVAKIQLLEHKRKKDTLLAKVQRDSVGLHSEDGGGKRAKESKPETQLKYYSAVGDPLPIVRKDTYKGNIASDISVSDDQSVSAESVSTQSEKTKDLEQKVPIKVMRAPIRTRSASPNGTHVQRKNKISGTQVHADRISEPASQVETKRLHKKSILTWNSIGFTAVSSFTLSFVAIMLISPSVFERITSNIVLPEVIDKEETITRDFGDEISGVFSRFISIPSSKVHYKKN